MCANKIKRFAFAISLLLGLNAPTLADGAMMMPTKKCGFNVGIVQTKHHSLVLLPTMLPSTAFTSV